MITQRVAVSLVGVALAAAACSSSGGGSAPTQTRPPSTVPVSSSSAPVVSSSSVAAGGPSVEQPCSFITAAQMSTILGVTATVQDDGFRCKYLVGSGWLEVELMQFTSPSAADIWSYDMAHGSAAPGVGDAAYIYGAAMVAKLGDVFIDVDGDNLPQPPDNATLTTIVNKIIQQIP